jgi:hypothetical protein
MARFAWRPNRRGATTWRRVFCKERQGKTSKTKGNFFFLLGFLWPIRGFSMGYSESKLKNLPLAQFTLRVVSVASRNSPSLSLSAASSAADCSVQGEDHTTFSVFLQLFEAKINCPLNLRDCSLPSAAPTATHKKSPVRGCGLTGQVTSALRGASTLANTRKTCQTTILFHPRGRALLPMRSSSIS